MVAVVRGRRSRAPGRADPGAPRPGRPGGARRRADRRRRAAEQASAGLDRLRPSRVRSASTAAERRLPGAVRLPVHHLRARAHRRRASSSAFEARLGTRPRRARCATALGEIAKIAALGCATPWPRRARRHAAGVDYEISYGKAQVTLYRHLRPPLAGLAPIPESSFTGRANIAVRRRRRRRGVRRQLPALVHRGRQHERRRDRLDEELRPARGARPRRRDARGAPRPPGRRASWRRTSRCSAAAAARARAAVRARQPSGVARASAGDDDRGWAELPSSAPTAARGSSSTAAAAPTCSSSRRPAASFTALRARRAHDAAGASPTGRSSSTSTSSGATPTPPTRSPTSRRATSPASRCATSCAAVFDEF